jgi:hypothetical protein
MIIMSFSKFGVNNSQGQVQQEEGTDEYQWHEVQEHVVGEALLHLTLDITPTLKCYTLEHSEYAIEQVIEVRDTIVGVCTCFTAKVTTGALCSRAHEVIWMDYTCLNGNTSVL